MQDQDNIIDEILSGKNETFCIFPFISVTCHQNGAMSLCCEDKWIKEGSILWNIDAISIKEYFNSKALKDIRKKMLSWEKIKYCSKCYINESNWIRSKRYFSNSKFSNHLLKAIKNTNISTWHCTNKISYLDVRFSNLCNLACKMCSSFSSSAREKIEIELWYKDDKRHSLFNSNWKIEDFKEIWKNLQEIYIVWWEPFLHKQFKELITYLCKNNYAKNIFLRINTNLTIIDEEVFWLLPQFKKVQLFVSCDGYKESYNKIRLWWSWDVFKKNFLYLLKVRKNHENISIKVNIVVQIDNIAHITLLYSFFENLEVYNINLLLLSLPSHFNIQILPNSFREKQLNEIERFSRKTEKREIGFKDIIIALKNGKEDKTLLKKYIYESRISEEYVL